jgi:hypothetical protein
LEQAIIGVYQEQRLSRIELASELKPTKSTPTAAAPTCSLEHDLAGVSSYDVYVLHDDRFWADWIIGISEMKFDQFRNFRAS